MLFGFEHEAGHSRTVLFCLFESETNESCLPPAGYVVVEKVLMLRYEQAEYHLSVRIVN
jgi:hypothetical protein